MAHYFIYSNRNQLFQYKTPISGLQVYMRSQNQLTRVNMGSYLTFREPYEDQRGLYWAKEGYWRPVGGSFMTKWGQRGFIWIPKARVSFSLWVCGYYPQEIKESHRKSSPNVLYVHQNGINTMFFISFCH